MKGVRMFKRITSRGRAGRPHASRALGRLDRRLSAALRRQLGQTRSGRRRPFAAREAAFVRAAELLQLRHRLAGLASIQSDARRREALVELQAGLLASLRAPARCACRREVIDAVGGIDDALEALPQSVSSLVVPGDLLRRLARQLMPPERMIVAAAEAAGSGCGLRLTSFSDVTDEARAGIAHVSADPAKLGTALRAMDADSLRLGAWFHSHPGSGPGATLPSGTDRRQYADWIRDYDSLVAAIVTADGYVRFWGDAVERGRWMVSVTGPGVEVVDAQLFRVR